MPRIKPIGTPITGRFLYMTFGALVWALHLTSVYAIHTFICVLGYATIAIFGLTLASLAVVAATLIALLVICAGGYLLRARPNTSSDEAREEQTFEDRVMTWIALLSAFGILWAGIAAMLISPCAAFR